MLPHVEPVWHALRISGSMTWQVTWSLILGFTLVRRGRGPRPQVDDRPAAAGRPAAQPRDGDRSGRGVLVVLVRRRRAGALAVPQGRRLHVRDGIPVRVDEPGDRTRPDPGAVARLAVHARGVRRRTRHDRAARRADAAAGLARLGRPGARARRARRRGLDGGPRRDGHVRRRRGQLLEAARVTGRASRRCRTTS